MFNNYVFFDYNVEAKDESPIIEEAFFTGAVIFSDDGYFTSADKISTEINDNKMYIINVEIIVARENYELYVKNPSFLISEKEKNSNRRYVDKRVEARGTIYPTTENYKEINKTFKLDNIDFKVLSLGDFNFGTLMHVWLEIFQSQNETKLLKAIM
ncbi:hypothetical protein ACSW9K_10390 [Clostridium perfringens]